LYYTNALVKWIKAPVILHGDSDMIDSSLRIIATLCFNEEVAWQLVDQYGIIKYLEHGGKLGNLDWLIANQCYSKYKCILVIDQTADLMVGSVG
jgi:hypothetical protein